MKIAAQYECDLVNVNKDGNCFYHTVSDQLWRQLSVLISPDQLRAAAVDHVIKNLGLYNTSVSGSMHTFVAQMSSPGEWADAMHVTALFRALHINLVAVRSDGAAPTVCHRQDAHATVYLGYEVGRHYQSLVPHTTKASSELERIMKTQAPDTGYPKIYPLESLKNLGVAIPYPVSNSEKEQQIKVFVQAINQGDVATVEKYLKRGMSPRALGSSWSLSPAFLVAYSGSIPVMEALLKADSTQQLFKEKDNWYDYSLSRCT